LALSWVSWFFHLVFTAWHYCVLEVITCTSVWVNIKWNKNVKMKLYCFIHPSFFLDNLKSKKHSLQMLGFQGKVIFFRITTYLKAKSCCWTFNIFSELVLTSIGLTLTGDLLMFFYQHLSLENKLLEGWQSVDFLFNHNFLNYPKLFFKLLLKLNCDSRFQRAFTACSCVFKVITLVGSRFFVAEWPSFIITKQSL